MAYSHDKTLLAKLGFADPDKSTARHDLACTYCAQPAVMRKILAMAIPAPKDRVIIEECEGMPISSSGPSTHCFSINSFHDTLLAGPASFEVPLSKGEGQYKTTIGFIDVLQPQMASYTHSAITEDRRNHLVACFEDSIRKQQEKKGLGVEYRDLYIDQDMKLIKSIKECDPQTVLANHDRSRQGHRWTERAVGLEVKIAPVTTGTILRQINLYRDYAKNYEWIVVTAFPMNETDLELLASAKIRHAQLGPKFDEYVAAQNGSEKRAVAALI